jgi:hypothetical protein
VWKSKCYDTSVLNLRVDLHAIDATPARWRGDAGSSPLDGASTAASSPRNDFVKNCAPDALVDFHTDGYGVGSGVGYGEGTGEGAAVVGEGEGMLVGVSVGAGEGQGVGAGDG